jgi:uncharacterized protein
VEAIADLEVVEAEDLGKSLRWVLRFPAQQFKLGPGDVDEPLAGRGARLLEVDEAGGTVVVQRGKKHGEDPPQAIAPGGPYRTEEQEDALWRLAGRIMERGLRPCGELDAATDLLLRRPPRLRPARRRCATSRSTSSACRRRSAGSTRAPS